MKMFRKDRGFTLVELMVVVLIIGILIAIAVPIFNAAKASAQKNTCWANQRTIEGAAQSYNASNGTMPANLAAMVPSFLKTAPTCPTGGAAYTIDASGTVSSGGASGCAVTTPVTHGHY